MKPDPFMPAPPTRRPSSIVRAYYADRAAHFWRHMFWGLFIIDAIVLVLAAR